MNLLQRIGQEPLIFGHRGVPDETPENTVSSFQKAVELGLDGVELDARLCKSGELVVFHDDRVDKLPGGSGHVADLSYDDLKRLDAGIRCGERFRAEKIPLLEEVLETLSGKMIVNIELKSRSIRDDGLERKVVALVGKMSLQSSVILSSFNPFSIHRVTKLDPDLKIGLLFSDDQPIHLRKAWATHFFGIDGVHPRYPLVTAGLIEKARKKNWFVNTWTVDDNALARRLFDAGVAVVITNHPRQMFGALKTHRENP
ncbi:glycerophosphodiester phosphodiesterase [Candidatus Poribacteria bacterium]|nr:glycerophosphodiester phosphodiesterase [Candidatus Poribacteria bacterium]